MTETTPLIEELRSLGFEEAADNIQEIHDSPELRAECHYNPNASNIDDAFEWGVTKQGYEYWDALYWGDPEIWVEKKGQDHD